jgi:hypothetical protein
MADIRESFTTLEGASQEGLALRAVQEGDSGASKNGSIGFAFKDDSGNVILPALDASGNVPVSGPLTDTELRASPVPVTFGSVNGDGLHDRGTIAGNASLTTVASITLAVDKIYDNLDFVVSCFRDCRFQVILSDNAVETILADAICGPGSFSQHVSLRELEINAGSTGAQLLLIKGINLNALSDMYAAASVKVVN